MRIMIPNPMRIAEKKLVVMKVSRMILAVHVAYFIRPMTLSLMVNQSIILMLILLI